jgi:formylglycine-generating enzyme required for sulfatase activity
MWTYPYGNEYDGHACNGADHGLGAALPTGDMATCEGAFDGIFDFSGNVAEWTADVLCAPGGECNTMGGSFDSPQSELVCDMPTSVDSATRRTDLGFRCCRGL